ncbi:MAG: ABC transporter permease, partial [Vicinamibacteria bacterium]
MQELISNIRLALRQLARAPGFAAASSAVLALGIGLNAAMLGLTYTMVFAERPFERPAEIVQLFSHNSTEPDSYRAFSYPAWQEISKSAVLDGVLAHRTRPVGLREANQEGASRRTLADFVSPNYFSVLGVKLAQGRAFTEEEGRTGSPIPVAILSHKLWLKLGADPALVGGTIRVSERPFTVIGVAPRGFTGTSTMIGPEVFLPLGWIDSVATSLSRASVNSLERADAFDLFLVGRLRKDSSIESTNQALALTSASVQRALPVEYRSQALSVGPLPRFFSSVDPGQERALTPFSAALMGMTGSVLLIVCLNLASMFLARGQARRREFAVRLALGGGRGRIVRQLLTEGLVLSAIGGVLGAVLGVLSIDAIMGALFERLPITLAVDTSMTALIAGPTALFTLVATLMFAFGPALRHTGGDVIAELKQQGGEGSERRRRFLPRHPLVSLQIALSVSLLICAGLFVQMARQASLENTTFNADDTVLAEVDAGLAGYREAEGLGLYASIENRLRSLPGTKSASVAVTVPFGISGVGKRVRRAGVASGLDDRRLSLAEGQAFSADMNAVGAAYFDTLGLRLSRGRAFTDAEAQRTGSKRVAIVDEVLAKSLWPDGDAVGRTIEFAPTDATDEAAVPIEVIG